MRPVISVSLGGRAYQLEDDAHAALAQYLESAERALADNPDRAEVLADLEQAIGDKCERFLGAHKTVVTRGEIEQVIHEMGPVDPGAGIGAESGRGASFDTGAQADTTHTTTDAKDRSRTAGPAPKRLYQISDGALLSGVCKGISEYFNVDVTLVRLLFVLATVVTGGLAILIYVVMMFIVPYANTPEEQAAARGLPFNARVLVEQAKLKAAQLAEAAAHAARTNGSRAARAQWKAEWRRARAQWRHDWRRSRAQWRAEWRAHRWGGVPPGAPPAPAVPVPPLAHLVSSLMWAVLGILAALITVGWLVALFSLVTTGAVFGWMPWHIPLWVAVLGLIFAYQVFIWPLRALRHGSRPYYYGYPHPWHAVCDTLVSLALLALLVWFVVHHQQDVRHALETLQQHVQPAWHALLSGSGPTHVTN
jgi:phage shock protein PspC (stress-responsive transcriptional regulator)